MTKYLSVRVPRDLDIRLGTLAVRLNTSKQALVIEALEHLMARIDAQVQEQEKRGE